MIDILNAIFLTALFVSFTILLIAARISYLRMTPEEQAGEKAKDEFTQTMNDPW